MAVHLSLFDSPSLGILEFATVDKCVEGAHLLFTECVFNNDVVVLLEELQDVVVLVVRNSGGFHGVLPFRKIGFLGSGLRERPDRVVSWECGHPCSQPFHPEELAVFPELTAARIEYVLFIALACMACGIQKPSDGTQFSPFPARLLLPPCRERHARWSPLFRTVPSERRRLLVRPGLPDPENRMFHKRIWQARSPPCRCGTRLSERWPGARPASWQSAKNFASARGRAGKLRSLRHHGLSSCKKCQG